MLKWRPGWHASWLLAFFLTQSEKPPLTVSAAISLSDVLEAVAAAYARSGGGPIRFNFAGSNVLARQIVSGAPVDVFISADELQMDVVARDGALQPASRTIVASNQLAVVAARDRVGEIRAGFPAAAAGIRRLALGDPAAVPAGVYAREYLTKRGLWKTYEPRVVPMPNVRAALSAVENGSADAAIVYATDARRSGDAAVALLVPLEHSQAISYPAAVIARTKQPVEAARFLAFLQSAEARAIFARHGFLEPSGTPARDVR
jgi:molybdate transport system substrate-binding protein